MALPVIVLADKIPREAPGTARILTAFMGCILDESVFAGLHCGIVLICAILTKTTAFEICLQNTQTLEEIGCVLDFHWEFEDICLAVATGSP
jgi:hypothetical protein